MVTVDWRGKQRSSRVGVEKRLVGAQRRFGNGREKGAD